MGFVNFSVRNVITSAIIRFGPNWRPLRRALFRPETQKVDLTWLFMGSVLIWHMYWPLSSSCTFLICKYHVEWSLCDTDTRGLCVMTWSWIAWMALVSAFTHPTCRFVCKSFFCGSFMYLMCFFKRFCIPCIRRGAPIRIEKLRLCPLLLLGLIRVRRILVDE